jgi:hypothetical protein
MVGKDERGGGGGSGVEKATQEQVRLARLTQDPHSLDNDDTHFMKLVKKVGVVLFVQDEASFAGDGDDALHAIDGRDRVVRFGQQRGERGGRDSREVVE